MKIRLWQRVLAMLVLVFSLSSYALELPGVLKYESVIELGVPVSGTVKSVMVGEGSRVTEGDLLLELDRTPFKADLDKTSAELRLLEAEFNFIQKEHKRNVELYQRMVLSTVALDNSKLKQVRAESLMQAKKAELARVKYDDIKSQLHAPVSGLIIERRAEPGQTIRAEMQAPVLFRLADTSAFIAEAEVPGEKLPYLDYGSALNVRIAGKTYSAVVKSYSLLNSTLPASKSGRYKLRVKLTATAEKLQPGMPVVLILEKPETP